MMNGCPHCTHEAHTENMGFFRRYRWISAAAVLFLAALFLGGRPEWQLAFCLGAWGFAGIDVLTKAVKGLTRGALLDENFLMSAATLGAFALGQYPEGAAVMLFYQIGEAFQERAAGNSRRSIKALLAARPAFARLLRGGRWVRIAPEEAVPGDTLAVYPGERVPLDAVITEGEGFADTSALTGESVPKRLKPGDTALGGFVCKDGALTLRVLRPYGQSASAKVLELVEHAASKKAKAEHFISRFARWYTPAVVGAAVLLAVIPPLAFADARFQTWAYRALVFLVISCPCALVLSVPLGFFGGLGGAAKNGVLIKGGNYLEALSRLKVLAADKTGTLTQGVFEVTSVVPAAGVTREELLRLCALAEHASSHPVAAALRRAWGEDIDPSRVREVRETAGKGVSARVDGRLTLVGKAAYLQENGIQIPPSETDGICCAADGVFIGRAVIADRVKQDAPQAVRALKRLGVERVVLLTGDNAVEAAAVAQKVDAPYYYADLMPAEKVALLEELQKTLPKGGTLAFAGDGINDAPVLARADVGIAMGALGSDAAVEAADVVLMTDEPLKIAEAVDSARFTLRVVRQNIVFALAVKAAILALGAAGEATLWEAVFADVGVSVAAVLNSVRPLRYKPRLK